MSEKFDIDLSEVADFEDVNLADASDYADQTGPAPLQPGNYRGRVETAGRAQNQDGEPIDDNGYPQVQLTKVTLVGPEGFEKRDIFPFQKYSLRPVQYGDRKGTVPAVDLLRGFDDQLTFTNGKEVLVMLGQKFEAGAEFTFATNWIAKDSEYIKSVLDENGGDLNNLDEEERKELFKKAIFRGQKRFPKVNGVFVPEVVGPSGDTLQANVAITRIYPSSKAVKKMGPFKKVAK